MLGFDSINLDECLFPPEILFIMSWGPNGVELDCYSVPNIMKRNTVNTCGLSCRKIKLLSFHSYPVTKKKYLGSSLMWYASRGRSLVNFFLGM